jgi:hypothetical protein
MAQTPYEIAREIAEDLERECHINFDADVYHDEPACCSEVCGINLTMDAIRLIERHVAKLLAAGASR